MSYQGRIRKYFIPEKDRVLRAFFFNNAELSWIMGPLGSGKTLAGLQRMMRFARLQAPHPIDRRRRTRFVSVRENYRILEKTHIKDWLEWWPRDSPYTDFKGGGHGEPASDHVVIPLPDGTTIDAEIQFVGLGETNIESFADGWPLTGFHIGGADAMSADIYTTLFQRAGRYPHLDNSCGFTGATWKGGWMDSNAPNYGNHLEQNFVTTPLEGAAYFRQPGGLDPDAENLQNLRGGRQYYVTLAKTIGEHAARRKVNNLFGFDRSGKPVYPEYNPFRHYSSTILEPVKNRKIVCGLDQGRKPAAVYGQRTLDGSVILLRELVMQGVDGFTFGGMCYEFEQEQFPNFEVEHIVDPAAFNPTDTSKDDDDVWAEMFMAGHAYASLKPAHSFKRAMRERGMRLHMMASLDATHERFKVSNCMKMVHEALLHKMQFKRVSAASQENARYSDQVDKNDWSHPGEAAEYCVMGLMPEAEIIGRKSVSSETQTVPEPLYRPVGM